MQTANKLLKISYCHFYRCEVSNAKSFLSLSSVVRKLSDVNSAKLSLSKKSNKFRVLCADAVGKRSSYEVSKSTLYHELGLTVRDLRFQHANMLAVRNKKIVARFQNLKAIICSDAVLVIDPPFEVDSPDVVDSDVAEFWKTLPFLISGKILYTSSLPLEYRALEAIFTHTLCNFSSTLAELEPSITKLLATLTDPVNLVVDRSLVHVLLKNSARLNTFSTSVNEFCETLEELLECDEDVRDLCISIDVDGENRSLYDAYIFNPFTHNADVQSTTDSNMPNSKRENKFEVYFPRTIHRKHKINLQDEMEMLLDTFLRDAEDISNRVSELKKAIETSNTAILINLDSHRNLLLRLELQLTMGMFSCTLFGMIGIAFGMNLNSGLEEDPISFWVTTGLMFLGSGVCWGYLLRAVKFPNQKSPFLNDISSGNSKPPPAANGGGQDVSSHQPSSSGENGLKHKAVSILGHILAQRYNLAEGASDNDFLKVAATHKSHQSSNTTTITCSTYSDKQSGGFPKFRDVENIDSLYNEERRTRIKTSVCSSNRMKPVGVGPKGTLGVADLLKEHSKRRSFCTSSVI
ncbi:magnesium transporter MRS2 homolog, mitochondrial-like isoform X1 [Clavelina lepadiformis]|uniref:magnesium transporter MRS2 homolog, mitochondrial-like isoform X1 n=1 Tax=Clavelina lepadiformis TaxID=159417 RepID=UPI0040435E86